MGWNGERRKIYICIYKCKNIPVSGHTQQRRVLGIENGLRREQKEKNSTLAPGEW